MSWIEKTIVLYQNVMKLTFKNVKMKRDNKHRNHVLRAERVERVVRLNTRVKVAKTLGINLEWD